ncbi:MAG: aromatic ring-hydroxylating dioxygenase subunit alpha [Actinomycetota bacterium]|nr:aromatic ring-hydroxylating dioxygenase subunit alpha [Actinomycetota bacterium]
MSQTKGPPPSVSPPGPSVQELLDRERRPIPPALRDQAFAAPGVATVDRARYYSYEWHRLEVERLWRRVWQMACREEEIPEAGDHVVYDIVDDSLIVVRAPDGAIRAYHNSCLHRGTRLRIEDGKVGGFRCPFHGWTWDLDGKLIHVPGGWDFPHVEPTEFCLPEAQVATWGGFVFVNMDADCESFETYIENLPEQFATWPLENRTKAVHVCKTLACNWKVALEAFIEAYHSIATHPQILPYTGDANTQYDTWPGNRHVNRMITPFATPSPYVADTTAEQDIVDAMNSLGGGGGGDVRVPEDRTAREFMAENMRGLFGAMTGIDMSERTDCEMLDSIEYYLFPNLAPWAGILQGIVYRFRPNGDDPDSCLMDVMMLRPCAPDVPRPAPGPVHSLGLDESWEDAPELGGLIPIFLQDTSNVPRVQRGLKSSGASAVTFGVYQESRHRQFHETLDAYLARP